MFLDWPERKGEGIKPETNEAAGPRTPNHSSIRHGKVPKVKCLL